MAAQQLLIGVDHVTIGAHGIKTPRPAIGAAHACDAPAVGHDDFHLAAHAHGAADILEQLHHTAHQRTGAAARKPDAPFLLKRMDQRIDAGRAERIAANQQRVKTERLTQPLVLDVARHHRIHRTEGFIAHQLRRGVEHRLEIKERFVSQLFITFAEHIIRKFQEFLIAGNVFHVEIADLAQQFLFVVGIIENRAVFPHQAVKRHHRHQFDIVRQLAARQLEQFFQAGRIGDHSRAGIENEAIIFKHIGTAARLIAGFDQGRLDAGALQADGESQATKTGTNHCGGRHFMPNSYLISVPSARSGGIGGRPEKTFGQSFQRLSAA